MHNRYFSIYFILLLLVVCLLLLPITGAAKSQGKAGYKYVSDYLVITLRTGKSNQHRIIRSIDSGTRVRVLAIEDNYAHIKTDKGDDGWVLARFLVDQPPARDLLPPLQQKLAKYEAENKDMAQQLKEITKERNELKVIAQKYEILAIEHNKQTQELARLKDTSAKSVELLKQTETLTQKNASLQGQLDYIVNEIHELRKGNNKLWFLTGAGVILVGIVLGALLARNRKDKSSSWGAAPKTLMLKQP